MRSLGTFGAVAALVATLAGACGPGGSGPALDPIADQLVGVGERLVLVLTATDPEGDDLTYSYSTDVPDIGSRASMSKRPDGAGVFQWDPAAADVGSWFFDFTASDGSSSDTITIQIEVKSTVGNTAPVFREPLGNGTTLDTATTACLDINIVIEDADSTTVVLAQEETVIAGAVLTQQGGLSGTWHWCPSQAQIAGEDQYQLTLSADDLLNPKTIKHYLIVLRKPPKPDCPGNPPGIVHSPADESTIVNLTVTATISDDLGLKGSPLFYYSLTPPASPPNLGTMTQLSMILLTGTTKNGTWGADVPNPVAAMPAGSSANLYYVIVADDNDDAAGDCDHMTQAPSTGSYSMTVTNPGGSGGAGLCASCTADVQCGGTEDLCVRLGTMSESFCLRACSVPGDCPVDFSCSTSSVMSVDGASARQCVPDSGSCSDPGGGGACVDDTYEDNDSRLEASSNPVLAPGTYTTLVSCPEGTFADDEDWFRIEVTGSGAEVDIDVAGSSVSDLDLGLYDSTGTLIKSSVTLSSLESVSECLDSGTYYIRVHAWSPAENSYQLAYVRTAMSCGGGGSCTDDSHENDDNLSQARYAEVFPTPFEETGDKICAGDDDWYKIDVYTGETVEVDLTFSQASAAEDLDLHFHNSTGTDLTPCSETTPSTCSASQGQSADANEHYENMVATTGCAPCTYYVVVHGWDGAENTYAIRIGLK
jgi:hypothetical protein